MTDLSTSRRELKIKSGVVNRLFNDANEYRKEIESLENEKSKLVAAGEDPGEWALKNKSRMIDESKKMVDDAMKRLEKAVDALGAVIAKAKEMSEMSEDEELLKAEKILRKAKGDEQKAKGDEDSSGSDIEGKLESTLTL